MLIGLKQFLEAHGDKDAIIAVTIFMVGALQFLEKKDKDDIQQIAFDLAILDLMISPPNIDGYQTLSYVYIIWELSKPKMVQGFFWGNFLMRNLRRVKDIVIFKLLLNHPNLSWNGLEMLFSPKRFRSST